MKPKVLIFIDWFYPGFNSGGPVQSIYNLTEHLSDKFDFYVITRDTDYCEEKPMDGIVSNEWNRIKNHLNIYYCSEGSLNASLYKKLYNEINPDVLYINGIYSSSFSILPAIIFRNKSVKKIIGIRGMLAPSAVNIKGLKKNIFLSIARFLGLYSNYILHVTTVDEQRDVLNFLGSNLNIQIAPNLSQKVNIEFCELLPGSVVRIINVARISPEKNLIFAIDVLKNVSKNVIFDIYGPVYNKEYWEKCLELIKVLPNNIQVNYKGVLRSEEVINTISKYHLFVMPTLGENFGHVILQSLMASTPVLISDKTPWHNLQIKKAGFDLPLDQKLFSKAIESIFQTNNEYNMLRIGAFKLAEEYLNDEKNIIKNMMLFQPNLEGKE